MPLNAFMQIANAKGESRQTNYVGWVEIQAWEWEVTAETSWTKGGGASVGKPAPGVMNFEHFYDTSSPTLLAYICMGKSFDKVSLHMCKTTGADKPEPYFIMDLVDAFITKVNQSANEEGNVLQKVELVFKEVSIDYKPQGLAAPGTLNKGVGKLGAPINYRWNIPGGTASGGGG